MEATHASFEAEQRLRLAKFTARQQQEFEALLQRGARGRDELELRRVSEMERRTLRFRNIVSVGGVGWKEQAQGLFLMGCCRRAP